MQCLYRNRDDLLSLQPTKTSAEQSGQPQRRQEQEKDEPWCKCDRNCDDSNFFVQDLVSGQQSNNNFNFIIMLRNKKGTLRFTKIMCVRFADFRLQRSRNWFLGANLQYGINNYPKMQLRRNVLFRFEDLLGEHGIWDIIEKRFLTRRLPVGVPCSVYRQHGWPLSRLQFIEFHRIYILFHLAICQVVLRCRASAYSLKERHPSAFKLSSI